MALVTFIARVTMTLLQLAVLVVVVATTACNRDRQEGARASEQTEPQPPPAVETLLPFDTRELGESDFVIQIPVTANVDSAGGNFPDADVLVRDTSFCPHGCDIAIKIHRRISASLSSFVDSIAKPESRDAAALAYAPSILDSVAVNGRQARWVKYWCGDCEWHALFVAGNDKIAEIGYNIDSRDRSPARTKALYGVASTFSWR